MQRYYFKLTKEFAETNTYQLGSRINFYHDTLKMKYRYKVVFNFSDERPFYSNSDINDIIEEFKNNNGEITIVDNWAKGFEAPKQYIITNIGEVKGYREIYKDWINEISFNKDNKIGWYNYKRNDFSVCGYGDETPSLKYRSFAFVVDGKRLKKYGISSTDKTLMECDADDFKMLKREFEGLLDIYWHGKYDELYKYLRNYFI